MVLCRLFNTPTFVTKAGCISMDPLTLADIGELAALARRYPSVAVIFGHLGG